VSAIEKEVEQKRLAELEEAFDAQKFAEWIQYLHVRSG